MGCNNFKPDTDIPDLAGKVVLVTGGNAGLGLETVRQIAKHNPAHIYLAARSREKAEAAIGALKTEDNGACASAPITYLPLDLASLESVKAAAKQFLASSSRLDLLVNNAGIMMTPEGLTADGYEVQFGTNHMGHALLTRLLLPTLSRTAAAAAENPDVRVVFLSSAAESWAPAEAYRFERLKTTMAETATRERYGISKVANIHYAAALAERHPEVKVVSVHPGIVATNLGDAVISNSNAVVGTLMWAALKVIAVSPQKGALNQLWASFHPDVKTGEFYHPVGVAGKGTPLSRDAEQREKLWQWTEDEIRRHL
ncbi:putative oxidoreductase [Colletotrichum tanaceti]|uniref:Putative oxidoreductase n=1 Tax=Colletotrichum tanaceti TaxID=1306861 RepID=A0A4U6X239_9PEZI|nr:putative oxidoreductase [Colletotrichum tanaceti]KAJ0164636.1 putative oxidoreductase [Colletotrichum tanaceti]TKW49064.1 putative oxidoreductase [Colletotrichum tanaceti]